MVPSITLSDGVPMLLVPLSSITILSMIKDFMEDRKRRLSDNEENCKSTKVLREDYLIKSQWMSLCIGEIVKVLYC